MLQSLSFILVVIFVLVPAAILFNLHFLWAWRKSGKAFPL